MALTTIIITTEKKKKKSNDHYANDHYHLMMIIKANDTKYSHHRHHHHHHHLQVEKHRTSEPQPKKRTIIKRENKIPGQNQQVNWKMKNRDTRNAYMDI